MHSLLYLLEYIVSAKILVDLIDVYNFYILLMES